MAVRRFGSFVFHPDDGRLDHEPSGRSEHLRPKTARLLECLLDKAGDVVARETIIESVWGSESVVDFDAGLAALLRELRQALRSVGETAEVIETVPRRGYRLKAVYAAAAASRSRRGAWFLILAALAVVALGSGLGVWLALQGQESDEVPLDGPPSLAILPFQVFDEGDRLPQHLDLLLADTVLAELLSRPAEGLALIGRTSLRPYLGRDDVAVAAANDLGVDLLIEGSVLGREQSGWRVEMRLLAVPPGQVVWSTTVGGDAGERLEVLPIARTLAGELVAAWPQLRERLEVQDVSD